MINIRLPTVFGVFGVLIAGALIAPANTAQVTPSQVAPNPTTQREFTAKVNMCSDCHGVDGVPRTPNIPIIWGQDENYLLKQMHDFRSKGRDQELMHWAAMTLYEAELAPAMAYFAQKSWPAQANRAAANAAAPPGIAVCQACHQGDFRGARQAEGVATPRLAGQSYEYLVESMRQFADGERKNHATMAQLMASISPADREAMARYLAGL